MNHELYPLYDQLKIRKSELLKEIAEIEEALKEFMVEKEEITVRCELGEFTNKKAEKMITDLETANEDKFDRLNQLKGSLGNVEESLSAEYNSDAVPEMSMPDLHADDMPDMHEIDEDDEDTPEPIEDDDTFNEAAAVPPPPAPEAQVDRTVLDMEAPVDEGGSTVLFRAPTLVVTSGDMEGTEFRLKMGVTNIGSEKGNDVVISHESIAGKHAQVTFGPDGFTIFDYNTPTGITVNGKKISEHLMQNGDELTVGDIHFKFVN